MDRDFLARRLVHRVDVRQWLGVDDWNQDQTKYFHRVPCLVDQSSGRRVVTSGQGATLTYDYAVTIGPLPFDLHTTTVLENAVDQVGTVIFKSAKIGQIRTYRDARGISGYLAMAASNE